METTDHYYSLVVSEDGGENYYERSRIPIPSLHHGYGSMMFLEDGRLIVYKTGIADGNYVISDIVWKSANDNNRNLHGRTSTGIFLKGSLSSFVFGSTICSSFQYMDAAVKI